MSQAAFAERIGVPIDTIRNREQGKRLPAGPAKALLKIIHQAPEAALAALE
ncbi:helix-turn-helix domain-containing protein [Reyranella sp.]|uniref:helix-turn-helix domain-containing protein n=1 Tax=Reyranella sp. TaxID=1929291 RepID=UPI0037832075